MPACFYTNYKKHVAILNYCVKHIKIYKKRHFAKVSDCNQDVTMPDKNEPVEVICPKCKHTQIIYLKREDIPKCSECDRSMIMRDFLMEGESY